MADIPEAANQVVQLVTRGVITLVTDEVHGRMAKGISPVGTHTIDINTALENLPPLPELDDAPLGGTLGDALRTEADTEAEAEAEVFPADLFAGIVGMDYERRVLRHCVTSTRPQHALLFGRPGSAKSILLECLRRLPDSRFVVEFTQAGLRKLILEDMDGKGVLLIDEIDKVDRASQEALLTVMDGNIASAISGQVEERRVDVRVIAAANDPGRLIAPLRDRFIELPLADITVEERREVIQGVLTARHHLAPEEAKEVADLVAPHSSSLRDAEQLAHVRATDPALAAQMATRLAGATVVAPPPPRPVRRARPAPAPASAPPAA